GLSRRKPLGANSMSRIQQAVIMSAVRTPMGSFNGAFSSVPATKLGSIAITEALKRVHVRPEQVDEVFGATGARILTTLVHAMEANSARRGLASLCIGGGEALAIIVEQMS